MVRVRTVILGLLIIFGILMMMLFEPYRQYSEPECEMSQNTVTEEYWEDSTSVQEENPSARETYEEYSPVNGQDNAESRSAGICERLLFFIPYRILI